MTNTAIQQLQSFRLAEYTLPIPCYICGTDNTFDAELCTHCQAPMALAHQANNQKVLPQLVATVGASAVGKTVYLGMLMDMLSRQPHQMQMSVRGAFSLTLQQTTVGALSHCRFPEKTSNEPDRWNWVHCQVRHPKRRHPLELIMPDMAGEAILEEVEHPHTYRVIRTFLQKCSGALILADATRLKQGGRGQDFFTMKLVSYLSELDDDRKRGWRNRPVALVLTKADQCDDCIEDPAAFAKANAPGLWHQCKERFRCHRFFAVGVAGACAYLDSRFEGRQAIPLRIEPSGTLEPFEWLLENIKDT